MQLRAEILVEQVWLESASSAGSSADPEPYDTSTLADGRFLYYFKRIYDAALRSHEKQTTSNKEKADSEGATYSHGNQKA